MTTRTITLSRMRILDPVAEFERGPDALAPRVTDLNEKVVVFLDNLMAGHGKGEIGMNTFYVQLREKLEERFHFKEVLWKMKPKRGMQAPKELMAEVLAQGQVVINGSCT